MTVMHSVLIVALLASSTMLRAEETAAPPVDDAIVARWPKESGADEQFDGDRFVPLAKPPEVGEGPFTVSVWVRAEGLDRGDPTYGRGVARSTRDGKVGDWLLAVHPDGRIRFCNWRVAGEDKSGGHVTVDAVIAPDSWHQIVAAWDGTKNTLFVDGSKVNYTDVATERGWGTAHEVGRSYTQAGYYWSGQISEFTVRRCAMEAAEVAAAFEANPRSRNPLFIFEVKPAGDPQVSAAVDREILARLKQEGIDPAHTADDAEFLRRVTLDLVGRIPTVAETEAFLADDSPDKRRGRIDALLSSREMPYYWSQVLSDWLMPETARRDAGFVNYLRSGLATNVPWDRLVRQMLLARPSGPADRFAGTFLSQRQAALNDHTIGRDVGRALFGVNLRCAQCHDHPEVPEWTRERFFGLSAFFSRSFVHQYAEGNQQLTVLGENAAGELEYSATGGQLTVAKPVFLDGREIDEPAAAPQEKPPEPSKTAPPPVPPFSRREALADMALDPQSPWFKRAFVNRVWRELMGRGLVEPVDMMHEGNPATHPALLDLLADDFAEHGFDVRRLIGVIVHSDSYARSSRWSGENAPDETLYAAAVIKPMTADQFALSLPLAAGHYEGRISGRLSHGLSSVRPLPPSSELLAAFDSSPGRFEPTAEQALFLLNGDQLQQQFGSGSPLVRQLVEAADDVELVHRAYLSILSRQPTAAESKQAADYLSTRGAAARQELVWALLTSMEFRFNH